MYDNYCLHVGFLFVDSESKKKPMKKEKRRKPKNLSEK